MKKSVLRAFEDQYDVKVEWTTFHNMEEGISKMSTGQIAGRRVLPDGRLPLAPRRGQAAAPAQPRADPEPRRHRLAAVPEPLLRPGVAVHGAVRDLDDRHRVPARPHRRRGGGGEGLRHALGSRSTRAKTGFYDSYRDAISHGAAPATASPTSTPSDPAAIAQAKDDLVEMHRPATDARITVNGVYAKLPEDEFWVHQAWSGDIVGAQWYLPEGRRRRTCSATGTRRTCTGRWGTISS